MFIKIAAADLQMLSLAIQHLYKAQLLVDYAPAIEEKGIFTQLIRVKKDMQKIDGLLRDKLKKKVRIIK